MFYDLNRLVSDKKSTVIFENCLSGSMLSLGNFNQSQVVLFHSNFNKGTFFLNSSSSFIKLVECEIENYQMFANLDHVSILKMWNTNVNNSSQVFTLKNSASVNTYGGEILNFDNLVEVKSNTPFLKGESAYILYKTKTVKS
jgi:hypothetical protein